MSQASKHPTPPAPRAEGALRVDASTTPAQGPSASKATRERVALASVQFELGNVRLESRERTEAVLAFACSIVATVLAPLAELNVGGRDGVVLREVLHAAACVLSWVALVKRAQTLHVSASSIRALVLDLFIAGWALGFLFWLIIKVVLK